MNADAVSKHVSLQFSRFTCLVSLLLILYLIQMFAMLFGRQMRYCIIVENAFYCCLVLHLVLSSSFLSWRVYKSINFTCVLNKHKFITIYNSFINYVFQEDNKSPNIFFRIESMYYN